MKCPNCGFENAPGNKFCGNCGLPLRARTSFPGLQVNLSRLEEQGLVRPLALEHAYIFNHVLTQECAYESLLKSRQRAIHRQVAQTIEGEMAEWSEASAELARHYYLGGSLEKALVYSQRAGEQAAHRFAHEEALSFYRQALACAEKLNRPEDIAAIFNAIGDIQELRGETYVAIESYRQGLERAPTLDQRAALKAKIGTSYMNVGDDLGLDFLHAAREELAPVGQTNDLSVTITALGRHYHFHGQHSRAIELFERARELAEPLDNEAYIVNIYAHLAGAYQHLARIGESQSWAEKLVELGKRKKFPVAEVLGYEFLAEDAIILGNWEEGKSFALRSREIAERIGAQARIAWSALNYGEAIHQQGQLKLARAEMLRGAELAEKIGERRSAVLGRAWLALIEANLGDDEAARGDAETAIKAADLLGLVFLRTESNNALAFYHLQREEWEAALELCERSATLLAPTESRWARLKVEIYRSEALAGAGHLAQARELVAKQLREVDEIGWKHYQGVALRLQGEIAHRQGAPEDAGRALDQAVAILDKLGSRLELGRALSERARVQLARGDVKAARSDRALARAILTEVGARLDLARLERLDS